MEVAGFGENSVTSCRITWCRTLEENSLHSNFVRTSNLTVLLTAVPTVYPGSVVCLTFVTQRLLLFQCACRLAVGSKATVARRGVTNGTRQVT